LLPSVPFALLLALAGHAHAQATSPPSAPLPWQPGTELLYRTSSVDVRTRPDGERTARTSGDMIISIAEARADGFVQVWESRDSEVSLSGTAPNLQQELAMIEAMTESFDGVKLEVDLAADGQFIGLRNWAQLSDLLRQSLASVVSAPPADGSPREPQAEATAKAMLDNLSSRAAVENLFGRYPSVYNTFTAPALEPDTPVRYESVLPSPISSHQIPVIGEFEWVSSDDTAGTMTIRWTQTADPEKGRDALWGIAEALAGRSLPADPSALPESIVLEDSAEVEVHRQTGVIHSITYTRRVDLGSQRRLSTWSMELQGR
jgi:hypothetical protein